jgi:hypothetical protein
VAIRPELRKEYEQFLNPDVLRPRLLSASIFIMGFESLKAAIVDRLRYLFWRGFDEHGDKFDPRYEEEVLSRHRSPARASLMWLCQEGAISAADLDVYDRIRECRNKLAHQLLDIVSTKGLPEGFDDRFNEMVDLLRRIEVWWIQNFELAIDPEYTDEEVDPEEIVPGRLIALQLLCDIALGSEEHSRSWYEGFRERIAELEKHTETPPNYATRADD